MPGNCGLVSQDSSLLEGGASLDGSDTQSQTSTPRMRITPARKTGNFFLMVPEYQKIHGKATGKVTDYVELSNQF